MKSPSDVAAAVERRVNASWHLECANAEESAWPHSFALATPKGAELERDFSAALQLSWLWREHATKHNLALSESPRRVHGTAQSLASSVTVATLDVAAALLGAEWPTRIHRGRSRFAVLSSRFPAVSLSELAGVVRAVDAFSHTDFELLCTASEWFKNNDARGLTPRQVPIEGLHAKWLNTRQSMVRTLSGVADLGLLPQHPQRAHFSYLDPEHLAGGGRRHDSASTGDVMRPAYEPNIVIIAENKDTAIHFEQIPRAIAVEGAGSGAGALPKLDWIVNAPNLVYWGDIDAAGLEIVDQYRAAGLPVRTILMDIPTYDHYAKFGSITDAEGKPLRLSAARSLPTLTDTERALYDRLTDPSWAGPRRIEQERIPLATASDAVRQLLRN